MLPKIQILWKNALNKSSLEINFLQKTNWAHMSISPGVELGAPKIDIFEILYGTEMGN